MGKKRQFRTEFLFEPDASDIEQLFLEREKSSEGDGDAQ